MDKCIHLVYILNDIYINIKDIPFGILHNILKERLMFILSITSLSPIRWLGTTSQLSKF